MLVVGSCAQGPALRVTSCVDAMRKTVTLEPDIDALIRQVMRETGAPFKRVLNDALRSGLRDGPGPGSKLVTPPGLDLGPLLVDGSNFNQLASELEDSEIDDGLRRQSQLR